MGEPIKVPMAADIPLGNGYTVTFAALDPTTGAAVSGVTVSNYAIEYTGAGPGDTPVDAFTLIDPKLLHRT